MNTGIPTSSRLRPQSMQCVKINSHIVPISSIAMIDASQIEQLKVTVHLLNGTQLVAQDIEALELVMQLKPSIIEGKRLRYAKNMWIFHNWVGHPLMQLLAMVGLYRWAFWVHDVTVPKPRAITAPG